MSMIKRMVAIMNRRLIREGKEPIGLYWPGRRERIYPGVPFHKRRQGGSTYRSCRSNNRTYKVKCPYCQRIFTRKTPSLKLRSHRDSYGFKCMGSGTDGYHVL